ncbi:TlpA family protein disulfide reductase [Streptomyces sp. NPDC059835]|uniref:TlpA family protein disulfide reductase n=1 Tax=Streptomyces sp. NPDC059835 TaxID=3346967 RepID=UPI00366765EB
MYVSDSRILRSRRTISMRVLALSAAALMSAFPLAGCTTANTGNTGNASGSQGHVTGSNGVTRFAKAERSTAPQLSGGTVDGETLDTSTLKGKVIVLNVWGSSCPPCRSEAEYFAKVSKELESAGQPVAFVGINTRDNSKQNATEFEKNFGITYPSLFDPAGELILRFPKGAVNPQAIPSTIVIDKDGKIAARVLAPIKDTTLLEMINPILAEQ